MVGRFVDTDFSRCDSVVVPGVAPACEGTHACSRQESLPIRARWCARLLAGKHALGALLLGPAKVRCAGAVVAVRELALLAVGQQRCAHALAVQALAVAT